MATSQNALIQIELARTLNAFAAMTDSGDNQRFTLSGKTVWSGKSGYSPDIRPNGIVTGQFVLTPHASSDTVTVAAFTAYSKGTLHSVSATSTTFTRPGTASFYQITSITMASDGSIAKVDGTSSATAFSTTRDAAGGPPLIPTQSVEIGQIKMSSSTAAVITTSDILQDIGDHTDYADVPGYDVYNIGGGSNVTVAAEKNAYVKFNSALPDSHTGAVAKGVYAKVYTPTMTSLTKTVDFKASEVGISKTSEKTYTGSGVSGAIGAMSADTVGDVSFTFFANDGITDAIIREKNEIVTVKFFQNANSAPYILSQGMLGIDRTFPSGEQNKITCTVYCESQSIEFAS